MKQRYQLLAFFTIFWSSLGLSNDFSLPLDIDNTKSGIKVSTVDLDDNRIDDTVGLGVFFDIPHNDKLKVGSSLDFWQTVERSRTDISITDISAGVYAKAYFLHHSQELAPYAVAGSGFHHILHDGANSTLTHNELSFDVGGGFDMKINNFMALNGELKLRSIDNYDYTAVSVSVISRF